MKEEEQAALTLPCGAWREVLPQKHVGEGIGEEHSPQFAIRSDGNSSSKKIPLQRMKELQSALGKNVFQGMAPELNTTHISLGGP